MSHRNHQAPARLYTALAGLLLLLAGAPALAQQAEDIGEFRVHYNTMNTAQLQPDVASAYGIQRAGNRALINIAVLRKGDEDMDEPARASVQVQSRNLAGQRRDIEMREVEDQGAIYYIGSFRIADEETLNFQVEVQPEGEARPSEFSFRQQFYIH